MGKTLEALISIKGKIDPSLQKSMKSASDALNGMGKPGKIAVKALQGLPKVAKIAGKALQGIGTTAKITGKALAGIGKTTLAAGKVAAAGMAGITAATAAFTGATVKSAAEYETAFAKTATLLKGSEKEIKGVSNSIIKLSNNTGIATEELADTTYNAISAGVNQADAVEFAGNAAKLAAAGFTDSATAVDVMTTAMNAYGKGTLKAEQVSDYLITTQNLGKTSVNELAASVGKVIPLASAYGVKMDNLSTAYAQLTAGGIATAEAGTYLKSMLGELGSSGSKVSKVLKKETGKNFAQLTEEGKSLGDVLEILGKSVKGDSGKFNELWSKSVAGIGALSLLNAGTDAYNDTLKQMRNSTGATNSAYETVTDTLEHQIEVIKNLGKNFMTSVGQEILPLIKDAAKDFIPAMQSALQEIMPIMTSLVKTVAPIFKKLVSNMFPLITKSLEKIGIVAGGMIPYIEDAINGIMPIFSELSAAIMPIADIIVEEVLPLIPGALKEIGEMIQEFLPIIFDAIKDIVPMLIEVGKKVLPLIFKFVKVVGSAVMAILPMIVDLISQLLPTILQIAEGVMPVLCDVIGSVFAVIQNILPIIMQLLSNILPPLQQFIIGLVPIIQHVLDVVVPLIGYIAELMNVFLTPLIGIIQTLMPIIVMLADTITTILGVAIQTLMPIIDAVIGALSTMAGVVADAFSNLADLVKVPMNAVISLVNKAIGAINKIHVDLPDALGGSIGFNIATIPMLATGGFTNGVSIAGEEGTEAVISFDPAYRQENLSYWAKAGQMLGADNSNMITVVEDAAGGGNITTEINLGGVSFSPHITINGNAEKEDVLAAIREAEPEFFDLLDKYIEMKRRDTYAASY
ncbi:MAG: phage tail tape measure protein [Lachnospiraceae bacterium]|nr:phage tail tape measure protein [Lachnospiraceae bacterium]